VHFSAHQPKVAGSTLTLNEKKAIMKELHRKKAAVSFCSELLLNFGSIFLNQKLKSNKKSHE
jgi:hypothetical protein